MCQSYYIMLSCIHDRYSIVRRLTIYTGTWGHCIKKHYKRTLECVINDSYILYYVAYSENCEWGHSIKKCYKLTHEGIITYESFIRWLIQCVIQIMILRCIFWELYWWQILYSMQSNHLYRHMQALHKEVQTHEGIA